MCRIPLFIMLVNITFSLHPHSDPYFLHGKAPYYAMVSESPASASGNPAGVYSGGRYHWLAGVSNHHGISAFNTILLGGATKSEKLSSFITIKHTSLAGYHYARTLGNLGISLKTSEKLIIGSSIKMVHIKLPEQFRSTFTAGCSAGAFFKASGLLSIGLAGSYYKTVISEFSSDDNITGLILDIRYKTGKNTYLLISGETISRLKPQVMALVVSEIIPGVRIMAGVGTGNEQLFAGISYETGRIKPGFVSGFNPSTGSSNTVLVSGQSK